MSGDGWKVVSSTEDWQGRAVRAEEERDRLRAAEDSLSGYLSRQAIAAHARGDGETARRMLDGLALIERCKGAAPPLEVFEAHTLGYCTDPPSCWYEPHTRGERT